MEPEKPKTPEGTSDAPRLSVKDFLLGVLIQIAVIGLLLVLVLWMVR